MNALSRAFYLASGRLATMRPVASLHGAAYRLLGGRLVGRAFAPVILLTTRGRRSGRLRTTPVFGIADGERIVVVGSNAGSSRDPDWYRNLRADPVATVQVGPRTRRVRARDATPDERERLWPKLVLVYPGYEAYRETAGREIPVVILEPVGAPA